MSAQKFRKRPVVIEAVQWTGENLDELRSFVSEEWRDNRIHAPLGIKTLEGVMEISKGDYVIKGINGEFYPCKPDIFEASYDKVEESSEIEKKYGSDLNTHPVNLAYYGIV